MKLLPLTSLFLPILTACTSGPIAKAILDEEVNIRCEVDGGIKVYETVKLPPDKFNKWGQVAFNIPNKERKRPDSEYYYTLTELYYKKGNPEVSRSHFKLYQARNNVLLGEAISYGRRGGDVVGPWHESSYRCPTKASITNLKENVFRPNTGE
jgi:hypothetical protein